MKNQTWQLQEAKSRFSELVETVIQSGAQTVTKHGKPAVVIISADEYKEQQASKKNLADAFSACPEDLSPLIQKRKKETARTISFDA